MRGRVVDTILHSFVQRGTISGSQMNDLGWLPRVGIHNLDTKQQCLVCQALNTQSPKFLLDNC